MLSDVRGLPRQPELAYALDGFYPSSLFWALVRCYCLSKLVTSYDKLPFMDRYRWDFSSLALIVLLNQMEMNFAMPIDLICPSMNSFTKL